MCTHIYGIIDVYSSIYIPIIYMEIQKKVLPVCIYNFTCIMCSTYNMDMYVFTYRYNVLYMCNTYIYIPQIHTHSEKKMCLCIKVSICVCERD